MTSYPLYLMNEVCSRASHSTALKYTSKLILQLLVTCSRATHDTTFTAQFFPILAHAMVSNTTTCTAQLWLCKCFTEP